MATKRTVEIKALDLDTIKAQLDELTNEYSSMKFDHSVKGLANPMQLVSSKKEIARLKTELRRRELEAMSDSDLQMRSKIRERRR